jgi:hypothetical protein
MKRLWASVGALMITALALTAGLARSPAASASGAATSRDIVEFQSMFGNHAPFIGSAGAVGGVAAAPLPWMVHSVPASLRGTNPLPFFAAVVSCTTAANGVITTINVITANVAATIPGGNAHIDQKLTLPHPCVAPIVMVTAPGGGAWLAVTGS